MWSSKDTPGDMEEILNDEIQPSELEVSEYRNFSILFSNTLPLCVTMQPEI